MIMWNHPQIDLPRDHRVTILNSLILIMIVVSLIYSIMSYSSLPDRIPIHFNLQGEADRWGHPGFIFIIQFISLPTCLIVYVLSRFPHMHNYMGITVTEHNALPLYTLSRLFLTILNFQIVILHSYLTWEMVEQGKGNVTFRSWTLYVLIGALIVTVIIYIVKIYQFKQKKFTKED